MIFPVLVERVHRRQLLAQLLHLLALRPLPPLQLGLERHQLLVLEAGPALLQVQLVQLSICKMGAALI